MVENCLFRVFSFFFSSSSEFSLQFCLARTFFSHSSFWLQRIEISTIQLEEQFFRIINCLSVWQSNCVIRLIYCPQHHFIRILLHVTGKPMLVFVRLSPHNLIVCVEWNLAHYVAPLNCVFIGYRDPAFTDFMCVNCR